MTRLDDFLTLINSRCLQIHTKHSVESFNTTVRNNFVASKILNASIKTGEASFSLQIYSQNV